MAIILIEKFRSKKLQEIRLTEAARLVDKISTSSLMPGLCMCVEGCSVAVGVQGREVMEDNRAGKERLVCRCVWCCAPFQTITKS